MKTELRKGKIMPRVQQDKEGLYIVFNGYTLRPNAKCVLGVSCGPFDKMQQEDEYVRLVSKNIRHSIRLDNESQFKADETVKATRVWPSFIFGHGFKNKDGSVQEVWFNTDYSPERKCLIAKQEELKERTF
jgi:hypothetical protein